MKFNILPVVVLALLFPAAFAGEPPAKVMVLGTFHMANPGRDVHNVEAVDVLAPERQAQLQRIADGLAAFRPTMVAVEWPKNIVDERYAKYVDGTLDPSRNEVVQLGFRLAKQAGLERVHGIDVDGNFPYGAVQQWAEENGRAEEFQARRTVIGERVAEITRMQREEGIAATLRFMNDPENVAMDQGFYMNFLRYGSGLEQPGAALLESWAGRNYRICATLLQTLSPGDRAVVIYGAGHSYYLRRCAIDTPGIEFVEANDFLPKE